MRLQTKRPAGYRGKRRLAWWKALAALVLAGILVFAGLFGAVMYGSYNHIQDDPQVMVIWGCRVMPEGHPSILLQDRLDTALDYWEEHPGITIVTSGGQGSNERVSEARCMADYLMDGGVPEDQILLEDRSHNTKENFLYSKELLADEGIDVGETDVLVVSNGFHLTRGPDAGGAHWIRGGVHPGRSHLPPPIQNSNVHPGAAGAGQVVFADR